MEPLQQSPSQWAESVTREQFTGLRAVEDRILAAGVPAEEHTHSRRLGPGQVILMLLLLFVPVIGWVAFVETAFFFQDGVFRIIGVDLDTDARLWMGGACFVIASAEVLWLLIWWWRQGRERNGLLVGFLFGIAVFAVLASVQIARNSAVYLPDGFDARIVPVGVAFVLAGTAGLVVLLGFRRGIRRPADPIPGSAVSRSDLHTLSVGEMNALLDTRRYVLQVLAQRGLVSADVDELDRKPLGSLE